MCRDGGKAKAGRHVFAELLSASNVTVNDKPCHGLVMVVEEVLVVSGERRCDFRVGRVTGLGKWHRKCLLEIYGRDLKRGQPAGLLDFLQAHSATQYVESCI